MESRYEPKVGDIILVKGSGFLPRAIQYWMRVYRRKRNLPDPGYILLCSDKYL